MEMRRTQGLVETKVYKLVSKKSSRVGCIFVRPVLGFSVGHTYAVNFSEAHADMLAQPATVRFRICSQEVTYWRRSRVQNVENCITKTAR
jgi:hypothetical protein